MESYKTLLLIVLLSTTSASDVTSSEVSEEVLYEGSRRASPSEECFCLVRHPMMVPVVDYLDNNSHGLDRLLVYLYKDKETGQIHAYVPGAENQRKIPDISLDLYGNEIFVVNEELTITTVFEKSKNVISLTLPFKSLQESQSPQQSATGGVHVLEPEISPHQLLIYDFSSGNIQTHIESNSKTHTQISKKTQPQVQTQTYPQSHTQPHSQIHSQTYLQTHPQTYSQNHIQSHTQNHPQSHTQSHLQTHIQSHTQNHPQSYTPSHSQAEIDKPSKSSTGGEFNYVYNSVNHDNQVIDDNLQPPHSPFHEIYHYPTPSVVEVRDNSSPLEIVTVDTIPDTIGVDTDVSLNEGSWSTQDVISANHVSTAFDVWFKGQIKKFRDEQLTAHYVLDVKTLRANIEKLLLENHIKLTANGKLQDSKGNIISLSRLQLRPVLIGDSVGYKKVEHRDNFVFPRDLTYLEAILITVSHPPIILGIVPLRKVTLPQTSQQTETISKSITSENKTSSANNTNTNKNNTSNNKTNSKQHKPERQKIPKNNVKNNKKVIKTVEKEYNITSDAAHGLPSPIDLENIFGKPHVSKQKSSNRTIATTEAALDGSKSLDSEEIAEISGGYGNSNRRGTIDMYKFILSQTLGELKDLFPFSISGKNVEKDEEDSSEDPLGFRIIGGDPATISGKMVNSRGRSGFIY